MKNDIPDAFIYIKIFDSNWEMLTISPIGGILGICSNSFY
jgi:hypothetical protein